MSKNFNVETTKDKEKSFSVARGLCKSCGLCIEVCPQKCITWSKKASGIYGEPSVEVDISKCIGCKICQHICPDSAIKVDKKAK